MKYRCVMCDFNTDHKTKYATHLKTIKHLSHNTTMDDKDRLIQSLREEVAYLKGKLEVYEKVGQKAEEDEEEEYEGSEEDCLIVFNRYKDTFDLNLKDEGTIERLAELRAVDDEVCRVCSDNVIQTFTSNEINFLNHLDVLKSFDDDDNAINKFIINILKECKIDITEKYKGRFKLFYNGEWKTLKESRELYDEFKSDLVHYFVDCYRAIKYYYAYNHKEKELGDYDDIKPLMNKIIYKCRDIHFSEPEDHRQYVINKVSSYK